MRHRFARRLLALSVVISLCVGVVPLGAVGAVAEPAVRSSRVFTKSAPSHRADVLLDEGVPYVAGEVIVRFADTAGPAVKGMARASVGEGAARPLKGVRGLELLRVPETARLEDVVAALSAMPGVAYAQPNYVYGVSGIPNDARFDELWGMDNTGQTGGTPDADIDAPAAWDLETGSSETLVAVIDTGIDYNHPDLVDNMWTNPDEVAGNGLDDDGNGYVDDIHGVDVVNFDSDPMDDYGHGTHCAGTVGGTGDNGIGVTGVAWDVSIMAVKFLDAGGFGTTEGAVEAIAYAEAMGADIMSNSWGGTGEDFALYDAIAATDALFVAAAGNESMNADAMPFYPACFDLPNIVSVGATDHNDQVAWFSNYGSSSVDVFAPGEDVLSCIPGVPPSFQPEIVSTLFSDDFSDLSNWDTTSYQKQPWDLSADSFTSAPYSVAQVGYQDDEDAWLKLASPVDLTGVTSAALRCELLYDMEPYADVIQVWASADGVDWMQVGHVNDIAAGGFGSYSFDLTSFSGQPSVYVAFSLLSDGSVSSDFGFRGAFIDDVEIVETRSFLAEDFSDLSAWDTSDFAQQPWELNTTEFLSGPSSVGQTPYVSGEAAWLRLATPMDLSTLTGSAALTFSALYDMEGPADSVGVWASTDGVEWEQIGGFTNFAWMGWEKKSYDMAAYAGESAVSIALSFTSNEAIDSSDGFFGVVIDDLSVQAGSWTAADYSNAYELYSGTSMATPHVSGLAALILSQKPELDALEIKGAVMDTVDPLSQLARKCVTGGRINAAKAMADHWAPSITVSAEPTYTATALIGLDATDDTGVESITFRFDDEPWATAVGGSVDVPYTIPGMHTMTYFATDVLGNVGEPESVSFTLFRGDVSYVAVAGASRFSTSIEASKRAFPGGASSVVIATGADWPDALGGAALAGVAHGPVLLVSGSVLSDAMKGEIERLGATSAWVLGGEGAVSAGIFADVEELVGDGNCVRIAGANRYDTADKIAQQVIAMAGDAYDGRAFVVTGLNFPDALGAAPIAGAKGWPILLSDPASGLTLPAEVTDAMVLGGEGAVSSGVEAGLRSVLGEDHVSRRGGATRYGTAALVAAFGVNNGLHWEGVGVSTGATFADALAGGAMLGAMRSVSLLTPGSSLAMDARVPIAMNKELIQTVHFVGGTGAVSDAVRTQVRGAVE